MTERHDYELKCDPAPAFLFDKRTPAEIERAIRAQHRETVRIAKTEPWLLGYPWQVQVAWARLRHSQSIARERPTTTGRIPTP